MQQFSHLSITQCGIKTAQTKNAEEFNCQVFLDKSNIQLFESMNRVRQGRLEALIGNQFHA